MFGVLTFAGNAMFGQEFAGVDKSGCMRMGLVNGKVNWITYKLPGWLLQPDLL